jgi:hypothetical protein
MVFRALTAALNNLAEERKEGLRRSKWTHRFNATGTFLTTTAAYYIYQSGALVGGTVNNGPQHSWFEGVGPGVPIAGIAPAVGVVNYTEWKFPKKDFLSIRPIDYLVDIKGERTGYATTYASWTALLTASAS